MADKVTHTLKHPRTITLQALGREAREEVITQITVRACERAKDLRAMDGHQGEIARSIALVSALSDQPEFVIDDLHPDDFYALVAIAQGFTPPGQPIGETA